MILGIDEVGRGPWAGPLVVGAVVLGGSQIDGLTDSKKLSKKRRQELNSVIKERAAGYGLGWVAAREIDKIGLSAALREATKRAVEKVTVSYNEIVIDGTVNFLAETTKGRYVKTMKKADLLVPSVSAASIIAKVARDEYMASQDQVYEGYNFGSHVGYGTAAHKAAILKLGVTPLHRLSFAPLAKYRQSDTFIEAEDRVGAPERETPKSIGDGAETEAVNYLLRRGHTIIERNWRTKYCEIDIISKKASTMYFTEVKHRASCRYGGGSAAITKKKQSQMTFAANYYRQTQKVRGLDMLLAVVTTIGSPPEVEQYIELH